MKLITVLITGFAFCWFMDNKILFPALVTVVLFCIALRAMMRGIYADAGRKRFTPRR